MLGEKETSAMSKSQSRVDECQCRFKSNHFFDTSFIHVFCRTSCYAFDVMQWQTFRGLLNPFFSVAFPSIQQNTIYLYDLCVFFVSLCKVSSHELVSLEINNFEDTWWHSWSEVFCFRTTFTINVVTRLHLKLRCLCWPVIWRCGGKGRYTYMRNRIPLTKNRPRSSKTKKKINTEML